MKAISLFAGIVLSIVGADSLGAQSRRLSQDQIDSLAVMTYPTSPTTSIMGFASFPWGAKPTVIRAKLGKPSVTTPVGTGEGWAYDDHVLSLGVTAMFYFEPTKGLVVGAYSYTFGMGNDCETAFGKFRDAIQQRYSELVPVENRKAKGLIDFCDEVRIGEAEWGVSWRDIAGNVVALMLGRESKEIRVSYVSPEGFAWEAEISKKENREKF